MFPIALTPDHCHLALFAAATQDLESAVICITHMLLSDRLKSWLVISTPAFVDKPFMSTPGIIVCSW